MTINLNEKQLETLQFILEQDAKKLENRLEKMQDRKMKKSFEKRIENVNDLQQIFNQ